MATKQVRPKEFEVLLKLLDLSQKEAQNREDRAEKRVAFFLAIASGSAAIIIRSPSDPVTIFVLSILLCFGLETLQFLNWHKIHRHNAEAVLKSLHDAMGRISPTYLAIKKEIDGFDERIRVKKWYDVRGGLAEFMYFSNGFLLAGIMLSLSLQCSLDSYRTVFYTSGTFLLFLWIQFKGSQAIRKIGLKKAINNSPAQPASHDEKITVQN
jgi:hypothetical protein